MADSFSNYASGLNSPGKSHFAITTSDSVDFTNSFRAIYVGTAGDVVIVALDGTAVTYKNAVAGSVIPMRGKRVNATNTTASNLVGIY